MKDKERGKEKGESEKGMVRARKIDIDCMS